MLGLLLQRSEISVYPFNEIVKTIMVDIIIEL